ncbi:thioredoxin domain-containing protein [uncultured Bifidobacterium sp.]|uniref:DsbA family protein n=1 Tax=uncultured Bifidobacterium sp. TaxID=165187 RepID=UPI0028DCE568|nr:thioredoxin domain-containing protein [uncultured Bifidobacterium sp.]
MAAGQSRNKSRDRRSARRLAEEARERRQAEQEARERRQQTIIGIIVAVVVLALVAVIGVVVYRNTHASSSSSSESAQTAYEKLQAVTTTPSRATSKGGFLMSKNGYGKKATGAPTVAIYMDPLCPGCGNFNRQADSTLISLLDAGQINIEIHPMAFLDSSSSDDYSSRVSTAIAYIAQNDDDPDHLLSFISRIYASDFQPSEGSDYVSVSDAKLKAQAIKAGVPKKIANKAFTRKYQDWLDAVDDYTPKRKELWGSSGSMSTPTVTVNGTMLDLSEFSTLGLELKTGILKSLGLTESQVGKEGELPSIGATGKPVSLSS